MMAEEADGGVPHQLQQKQFVNNPEMSDVVFLIGDHQIYAHRVVLGMHSSVFRSMLFNGMKESRQHEIPLVDMEKPTFLLLLEYMYCGAVPPGIPLGLLVSVMAAADQYDVLPLREICRRRIEQFLHEDTVLDVLDCASTFHSWELKEKCYAIIDRNTGKVFTQPSFVNLPADVVIDILKRDQIRCAELDVFSAVIAWGKHRCPNGGDLRDIVAPLVPHVRVALMRPRDILNVVEPAKVVPEQILLEAYRYASLDPDLRLVVQSPRSKARSAISEYPGFDTTLQATITIMSDNKCVTKRGTAGNVVVFAKNGFGAGVHRWKLKVEGLAPNIGLVSVGVAQSRASRTNFNDPYHWAISSAGQVYNAGMTTAKSSGTAFIENGHAIECVLDMHIGTLCIKNLDTYSGLTLQVPVMEDLFPAVGLHSLGNKVWFCEYS